MPLATAWATVLSVDKWRVQHSSICSMVGSVSIGRDLRIVLHFSFELLMASLHRSSFLASGLYLFFQSIFKSVHKFDKTFICSLLNSRKMRTRHRFVIHKQQRRFCCESHILESILIQCFKLVSWFLKLTFPSQLFYRKICFISIC